MDNDDTQIGRVLSRREVLALLGTAGAALLVGCGTQQPGAGATTAPTGTVNAEAATALVIEGNPAAATASGGEVATAHVDNATVTSGGGAVPACVVRPEMTEGPYYVDVDLVRSDIRSDATTGEIKPGTPLLLTFNVAQLSEGSCKPFEGAMVEIWHCDAEGRYSGVSDRGFKTVGQTWLRGGQVTDAKGVATFTTIFPGWYSGRTVHIHFKIIPHETKVFISQLFFDDTVTAEAFTAKPYAAKGQPDTPNSADNIYRDLMLLTATKTDQGYAATFDIGIDLATIRG